MKYHVRNLPLLKKILWADCLLGGVTAIIGLLWCPILMALFGVPGNVLFLIACITLLYALTALSLALQTSPKIPLLRALICANWIWTVISVALLIVYSPGATVFGVMFLVLQVVVVGGLAYLEDRQLYQNG